LIVFGEAISQKQEREATKREETETDGTMVQLRGTALIEQRSSWLAMLTMYVHMHIKAW